MRELRRTRSPALYPHSVAGLFTLRGKYRRESALYCKRTLQL